MSSGDGPIPLVISHQGNGDIEGKKRSTKQRGIYSETLGRSTSEARKVATSGPQVEQWANKDVARNPVKVQQAPGVRSFKPKRSNSEKLGKTMPVGKLASLGHGANGLSQTATHIDAMPSAITPQKRLAPVNGGKTGKYSGGKRRGREIKPKVIIPYEQQAGKLPRRLQIERKTRLYAEQNIDALLREAGVFYDKYPMTVDHETGQNSFLALEIFDNKEYEVREPEAWIAEGTDEDGYCFIDARGLKTDENGVGNFQPCFVVGYDSDAAKFLVQWVEDDEKIEPTRLSRISLNFLAEDPFAFVARVADSHLKRRKVEADIRYSLYVDSMPTDEIQSLDTEQVNRMLLLALNTRKLRQSALDTTSLIQEVNIDYARTMNKIIFDKSLEDPQQGLRESLNLPDVDEPAPECPYFGVVSIPFHDFSRHFSDFCFHSFYTKVEAITALRSCNFENLQLRANYNAFNTNISKTLRLEEFDQIQNSQISQLSHFVKEKWTASMIKCIKDALGGTGKGWFNLRQTNREVYLLSKLKKFIRTTNFMMEDTIRFLLESSLDSYHDFIVKVTDYKVTIKGVHDVLVENGFDANRPDTPPPPKAAGLDDEENEGDEGEEQEQAVDPNEEPGQLSQPKDDQFPLFSVDMVLRDGQIQYTTATESIAQLPLSIFDKALASMLAIPQIETRVMEHLLWHGNETKLASVTKGEPKVIAHYESIKKRMHIALKPLGEYLRQFKRYDKVIKQNIDEYIKDFAEQEYDIDEVRAEITKHLKSKAQIEALIPKKVWLGLVLVNCEDVRRKLVEHYEKLVTKCLDLFTKETRLHCEKIKKAFLAIDFELRKTPIEVEELVKAKQFRSQVPMQMVEYDEPIAEAMSRFEMLESFGVKITNDLFNLQWQTFGWPGAIHSLIEKKNLEFEDDAEKFLSEMKVEQQEFQAELMDIETKINTFSQYKDMDKVAKIAEKAIEVSNKLQELNERARAFNSNEMLLNNPATDYSQLKAIGKNFEPFYSLWTAAADWSEQHSTWNEVSFQELDGAGINDSVTNWSKSLAKVVKAKLIKENPGCLAIATKVKEELDAFKPLLPVITALRNPGMRERHWEALSGGLPFDFKPDESLTLKKVVEKYKLQNHLELITKIGERAGKEYQIEGALDKMETAWKPVVFEVLQYKKTDTFVIRGVEEIMQLLDEHVVMTQGMQFSAFKAPFEERIDKWSSKLSLVYEVIEEWLQVQRQWMALQSIFSSPDINKQLPAEGKKFATVNKTWFMIMSQVHANPGVLSYCDNPSLLEKLQDCNQMLQVVQKRLSEYLDKKRAAFARFYFLANEELLQILSQTEDPNAVQPHLKKCFENIYRLRFEQGNLMTAMFSGEGEEVPFTQKLDPNGKSVEFWLNDVEDEMKASVKHFMGLAVEDYTKCERVEWVKKWPGQTVLGGSQIYWTREVEAALKEGGHKGIVEYNAKWKEQLAGMVAMVRGDLKKIERMIVEALIVLDVHARDVIERLVEEGVSDPYEFAWICQMRYYMEEDHKLFVQMVQSRFPYCNEYLGNTLRLVITPLTDRCYMTLMSALSLHLGGAPAGPAGTGKTETVKDLSKCVAKQCVVFNCSDGLNYLAMSKFFKGLASSGAWACFDEFNRIDIEVLSVVAQQILTIWEAVRAGVDHFVFDNTELRLNPTCSVFITMNPGYAGRTELPDNLEVLFRPVAMMVPDYGLIGEIMLYSFGFNEAKALSRKMVATFRLCSEQLSAQDHYDYGMRAVKTVITRAGILKREDPDMDEGILLLRALCDVNVPKFLQPDLPLFQGIISDLFPGLKKPEIDYGDLMSSLVLSCTETGLQPIEPFLRKCIELYETTVVRHGLMLVGPTGGGKTSNLRTLQKAMTRLKTLDAFEKVLTFTLNPKAVTMGQLYGDSDPHTGEWSDGILAGIMRTCIDDETPAKKWVIFDGPVDAIWIENMNTVLDDNKKLCLVSGEILQLTPTMTMVFEVEDLAVASPATVSRCGMVYMEPGALGFSILTQSWLQALHPAFAVIKTRLFNYFDSVLECTVQFVRKQVNEPVPSVDTNLVRSCLNLLDAFLHPYKPVDGARDNDSKAEEFKKFANHIECFFFMSIVWSVGATTDKAGREQFSTFLRGLVKDFGFSNPPPVQGLVYDYLFDMKQEKWIGWVETTPYTFDKSLSYAETIVPTIDSIRYTFILDALVNVNKQVLFTGNTGTGKTINIVQYLSKLPETRVPISLIFSAATSANQIEDMLFGKMTKRRARVYGPPLGKRFVIFVDDVNMPAREKYFAQPPIEILRQWMDHNGWYNRQTLSFNEILDISFIGAMGPPGGGRNPVTPRFIRHFNNIAHTDLEYDSLFHIFHTIVANTLVKFDESIAALSKNCVEATVHVYNTVCSQLLPTPAKVHYTFNLRDLSAVFQGTLSSSPQKLKDAKQFVCLWAHENMRVFKDRLINDRDRQWMDNLLAETMEKKFEMKWDECIPKDCLLFGDYMGGVGAEQRFYDQVPSPEAVGKVMEDCLADYNEQNTPMGLVMFLDAIEHVSRVSRVLRTPGGNALLLGVGGSGRQSLTRLATFIAEFNLFTISVSKNYSMNDWHEDIKKMLLDAGLKEQPTVFLFNDTQITNEGFLEDVNNILNTGEVPNLYTQEDMDNIFAACKLDCQRKNIPATMLNAYAQFINRVKSNLHVVVCMSPLGDVFRNRLRMFPALVNCCTIDWFSDWPAAALLSVANQSLNEGEDLKLGDTTGIVEMFGYIHQSVHQKSQDFLEELQRHNYVTPTSYLELLNVFKFLLADKRKEVGGLRSKLQFGLDKLEDAEKQVAQLKQDLTEKAPLLVIAQKEVAEMMVQIEKDQKDASQTKEIVSKQEAEASAKAEGCAEIRNSAQADLDKALPMLDKAVECLRELNKSHIDEVRNFKKPPGGVVLTMEATCIMLKSTLKLKFIMKTQEGSSQKVPDYWETAQKFFLKNPKLLLETLQNFDKDNIPEKTIKEIKSYVTNEDFTVAKIEKASVACRAICMWVHAMYNYDGVSKEVEPKRIMLREAEAELAVVTETLNKAKAELAKVEAKLAELSANYEAGVARSQALEHDVKMCEIKLERAGKLIGGLGGEKKRWIETVAKLSKAYDLIVGDVLVSSGTIAYLGAFTADYRQALVEMWRSKLVNLNIPHTEGCNVRQTMVDPVQIRAWQIAGLPTDSVSTENGIIIAKARRWPLMIDPQGQAGKFIKNLGDQKFEEGMTVLKLTDKSFLQTLESCIRFGKWVLIESVLEELDPSLEPLLLQQLVNLNGAPHVKLGENMVPYSDQFHFYMCTSLPNPHYAPELQVKVTLLNFTITPQGLEDQMLGTVVAKEMPEMEAKKNNLTVQNARMKKQLQDIEDEILKLLSESSGDILEDETLINVLASSKKTSAEINERVAEAEIVEKEIDETRKGYIPVAKRASLLYFCIANLSLIDPMYAFSLQWFVNLFIRGIGQAEPSAELEQRLKNLNDYFTKSLYENVCRSLFEAHKLLFSFLLAVRILQGYGKIDNQEWRFLVAGAPPKKDTPNPAAGWISQQAWNGVLAMSDLPNYSGIDTSFADNIDAWREYYESANPDTRELPAPWNTRLNSFQKLLVLKCLRSDKMSPALQAYVAETLGPSYNEFPQFDLSLSYKDSANTIPLIFVLSRGSDPTGNLLEFATDQGFRDNFNSISLGQGQGPLAQKYIEEASKRGGWVLLQNCHLAISWLPTLERICNQMKPDEVHEDFRLWLTSAPTPKFPVSVLQNGVKMTKEPAKGLRANLMQSYFNFTDNFLNTTKKPDVFKKLVFSLCFFHANILERRKFGPLGWNIPYQFAENDLEVCITQLGEFIDMYEEIPYDVIHFLAYDVNYGGRVTDDKDRRTIRTILDDFMKAEVLNDGYCFSSSDKYQSIAAGNREHYLKYITDMSAETPPEVFGMHPNAAITSAQEETALTFSTILALLPRSSSGGGKSREEIIGETAQSVMDRTPLEWDVDTVGKKYPTLYSESMNTVLVQEIMRYNKLLAVMRQTLINVKKALKGELVMSQELESMADSLYNNIVPEMWEAVAYPSLMPLSAWVTDLIARVEFMQHWVDHGTPTVFWISGFFFPHGFLTGSLQNYARKTTKPVDAISFAYHVLKHTKDEEVSERPEDGIYIRGLFLQGCRWDPEGHTLSHSRPKELFTSFPIIWLKPEEERKAPKEGVYLCPVYKILTRRGTLSTTGHSTNFIMTIEVPTNLPESTWIKAGAALFAALTY